MKQPRQGLPVNSRKRQPTDLGHRRPNPEWILPARAPRHKQETLSGLKFNMLPFRGLKSMAIHPQLCGWKIARRFFLKNSGADCEFNRLAAPAGCPIRQGFQ